MGMRIVLQNKENAVSMRSNIEGVYDRMVAKFLCYHSIAQCTGQNDICHLQGFVFSFNIQVGLNRLPLAALMAYPMALYSALLYRGYSHRIGGS